MLTIRVIAPGRIKEPYLQAGLAEYAKRLTTLCRLEIIELADERIPANPSPAEVEQVKEQEGKRILQALADDEHVIALDIIGARLSSEQFAEHLARVALNGRSKLAFIIGGSCGLSSRVLSRADLRLSFGPLTYPHQLMRLILLEQIYRAFKINRGEPYHR